MLKLTTDKHEAPRGLSVTAELLVEYTFVLYCSTRCITNVMTIRRMCRWCDAKANRKPK